jgi:hypothetical protein
VELVVEEQLVTDGLHVVVVVAVERIAVGAEEAAGGGDGRRAERGGGRRGEKEILQETGQRAPLKATAKAMDFLRAKAAATAGDMIDGDSDGGYGFIRNLYSVYIYI